MTQIDMRVILGAAMGVFFAVWHHVRDRLDKRLWEENRFAPLLSPLLLLTSGFFVFLFSVAVRLNRPEAALFQSASMLLQAGLYYALLLALHPLLRRIVSGKGRAALWVLPNVLYCFISVDFEPRWVLPTSGRWLPVVLALWAVGAAAVLLWKLAGHIDFRDELLKDAVEAPEQTRDILRAEEKKLSTRREYPVLVSPAAKTPLSIGVFDRTIRIVLPPRAYSDEELSLIFRHELVHIRRQDSAAKLFLAVCTALSWFDPLVWPAMRRSCEDFESGCDEIVLADADAAERRLYAALLLDTAADTRGFTTCLSADAVSLRERLKNIVAPKRRLTGSLAVGLLSLLLFLTCKQVAFTYDGQGADTLVFGSLPAAAFTYSDAYYADGESYVGARTLAPESAAALTEYLSGLRLYRISTSWYRYSSPELYVLCSGPDGERSLCLYDRALSVTTKNGLVPDETYYHYDDIDWEYLIGLLETP